MPKTAKTKTLKVFRTAAGFHDAYVAAPTKKAALAAWGSSHNLFALGQAEEVTDPELCKAPLARPGVVINVSRGTTAQQLAALPADKLPSKRNDSVAGPTSPARRQLPRPARTALDDAERRIDQTRREHDEQRATLLAQIEAVKKQLTDLDAAAAKQIGKLEAHLSEQRAAYEEALAKWQAQQG